MNIRFLVPARNDGTNASDKKNTSYSPRISDSWSRPGMTVDSICKFMNTLYKAVYPQAKPQIPSCISEKNKSPHRHLRRVGFCQFLRRTNQLLLTSIPLFDKLISTKRALSLGLCSFRIFLIFKAASGSLAII